MNNNSRFPTKINLIVRAVVGVYLLYLSYGLYHDRGVGDIQPVPLALIIAAFTIIGVGLIVYSGYLFLKGKYAGGPADIEVEENEQSAQQMDDSTLDFKDAEEAVFTEVEEIPEALQPDESGSDEENKGDE